MNRFVRLGAAGIVPSLIVVVGVVLMVGKIHVDSEPGGIPLLLILLGTAWHLAGRSRAGSRHE